MRVYTALLRRELGGYFSSATGYVIIGVTLLLLGFSFVDLISKLNADPTDAPLTQVFYSTYYFWLILLLTSPVITMRSFASEKSSGTFETLMTAPVRDIEVVLAKFSGAFAFYLILWLPLVGYSLVTHSYANSEGALDGGVLAATFLGIALIGSFFMSMGCFASALTRSQMIAAMITYGLCVAAFILSLRSLMKSPMPGWASDLFAYISMIEHMELFARGVVDAGPVVLYLSLTALFLFLTVKTLESRRWK